MSRKHHSTVMAMTLRLPSLTLRPSVDWQSPSAGTGLHGDSQCLKSPAFATPLKNDACKQNA
ncbi:hypothetical protein PLUA15_160151 [Pseudomonas lundensis]|uniref:Uncharacterized protein n=1 Tax=Pseudomonas lundensis TaxID=86185 RepID=A0AAX2H4J7_9PSED|nr:hypothetical protein PLUA15_160151 [Pseudomonas lundensis]